MFFKIDAPSDRFLSMLMLNLSEAKGKESNVSKQEL